MDDADVHHGRRVLALRVSDARPGGAQVSRQDERPGKHVRRLQGLFLWHRKLILKTKLFLLSGYFVKQVRVRGTLGC